MFYGKVIVDLHTVVRNNAGRACVPFTQLPAVVTPCRTIVKYNQDTDNDIVKTEHFTIARIPHVALLSAAPSSALTPDNH